ncbi:MAG: DNA-binding protein [Actinomycetota bacterium]
MAGKAVQALTLRIPKEEYDALRAYSFVTELSINEVAVRAIRDYLVAEGRRAEFDALLHKARTQYRTALNKLADM